MRPADRRERARLAANERWAKAGAREAQSAALRAATRARMEAEVDPDGTMTPAERAAAVANLGQAISARLRLARARKGTQQ